MVIHGDVEETCADAITYHYCALLIDEDSNQPAHPAGLFPVQVGTRRQTEVIDVKLLSD